MVKILIVDDARFMRLTLTNIFSKHNFEIVGVGENGQQAIDLYKELSPDIVTLDITMPIVDGMQALQEIMKYDPHAKVIMCSAMGQQKLVVEAIENGAKDFIIKPFDEDRVINTINHILSSNGNGNIHTGTEEQVTTTKYKPTKEVSVGSENVVGDSLRSQDKRNVSTGENEAAATLSYAKNNSHQRTTVQEKKNDDVINKMPVRNRRKAMEPTTTRAHASSSVGPIGKEMPKRTERTLDRRRMNEERLQATHASDGQSVSHKNQNERHIQREPVGRPIRRPITEERRQSSQIPTYNRPVKEEKTVVTNEIPTHNETKRVASEAEYQRLKAAKMHTSNVIEGKQRPKRNPVASNEMPTRHAATKVGSEADYQRLKAAKIHTENAIEGKERTIEKAVRSEVTPTRRTTDRGQSDFDSKRDNKVTVSASTEPKKYVYKGIPEYKPRNRQHEATARETVNREKHIFKGVPTYNGENASTAESVGSSNQEEGNKQDTVQQRREQFQATVQKTMDNGLNSESDEVNYMKNRSEMERDVEQSLFNFKKKNSKPLKHMNGRNHEMNANESEEKETSEDYTDVSGILNEYINQPSIHNRNNIKDKRESNIVTLKSNQHNSDWNMLKKDNNVVEELKADRKQRGIRAESDSIIVSSDNPDRRLSYSQEYLKKNLRK